MAPKSKDKIKPSHQTLFVLDALEEAGKKEDERWDTMQERIDLLFAKLEAAGRSRGMTRGYLGSHSNCLGRRSNSWMFLDASTRPENLCPGISNGIVLGTEVKLWREIQINNGYNTNELMLFCYCLFEDSSRTRL
jgi:hypothetical protein